MLSRPSNKHNEINNSYIDISWNKVSGDKTYVYDVYRDGLKIASRITNNNYTDKEAISGKIHSYCVKALDKDNNYYHVISSESFYAGNKITKEINLTPTSSSSMKITWDRPSSDVGLKYIVKKRNNEDTDWIDLATTTDTYYVDNTVSAGNTYKYYIQIRDTSDNYITSINNKSELLNIEPDRVAINNTAISLTEDDSASLSATVYPDNSFDKSVTWSSSNSDVAEVSANGTVTAKSAGTAIITAKTSNNKTAQCTVTVAAKATAHTHVYGEWVVETEATCETDGAKYRECSCGDKEKGVIYATGHSYAEEWTVIKEANCHEEGEKAHVCSICGNETDNTIIEKTAHNFGDWVREENSSCSAEGNESRTCSICGDTEERATDVTNHDYVLTNETQPAIDAPGTRTYVCSVCGDVHTEEWVETISAGTIKIGGTIANPGETLTVPVSIEDNPGFAGFTFDVKYDETAVTPVEIIKSDLTESGTFEMNIEANEEGETVARVTWFTSQNMTDNGELFNIQFKVNSDAQQGRYPVSVMGEISNDELSNVIPDILTDYITVGDYLKGDVNLDKVVNGEDATLLARYIVAGQAKQQTMFSPRQRKAANVYDSDKDVLNHKDGIRLSQIIAGYDISLLEQSDVKLMSNEAASVTIESFDAIPGSEVHVPVYIEDNPGIAGFNMHLDYDKDKLTLMSIERDEIIQDGRFETTLDESENSVSDGVDIYWIDSDNITDDGVLFYAVFEVSDAATIGEVLPVEIDTNTVDFSDMYLDSVSTEITQGTVTLAEYSEDNPDDYESEWMPYDISNVSMNFDSNTVEDIPTNGNFDVNVDFSVNDDEAELGTVIVAAYDENGSLINVSSRDMTADMIATETCSLHINESENTIADIKVFIWNSLGGMQAMSDYVRLWNTWLSEYI